MLVQKLWRQLYLLLLLTVVVGCGNTAVPVVEQASVIASVEPSPSVTPAVPVIRFVPDQEGEPRNISFDTAPQNNCAGTADVSYTVRKSRTIEHVLEFGQGITINPSGSVTLPGITELQLGSELMAQYGVQYGQQESIEREVTVAAKAETHMQHTLQLYDYWEKGVLEVNVAGKALTYPYKFRKDFKLVVDKSERIPCVTPTISATATSTSTSTTVATATSTPTIDKPTAEANIPPANATAPTQVESPSASPFAVEPSQGTNAVCPPSINFGQTISCSISTGSEIDTYEFTAEQDDVIVVTMARVSQSLEPSLQVYDPNGNGVAYCGKSEARLAEVSCTLSNPGSYTIQVADASRKNPGDYSLYLQRLNNPGNATTMTYGETIYGTIISGSQRDSYTFDAEQDDVIVVTMARASDTLEPSFQVYDPNGKGVAYCGKSEARLAEVSCTLPNPGVYSIQVVDASRGNPGKYSLYLQRFNNPGKAKAIGYNQTVSSVLETGPQRDSYTFDAQQDDVIVVTMTRTSGTIEPSFQVYDPNGKGVAYCGKSDSRRSEVSCTLPNPGTYSIQAADASRKNRGEYTLVVTNR